MKKLVWILSLISMLLCVGLTGCSSCEHEFVDTEIPATCKSYSYTEHKCSLCGKVKKDNYGKTYANHQGVEECTVCGKSIWSILYSYFKKEGQHSDTLSYHFMETTSSGASVIFSMQNENKVTLFSGTSSSTIITVLEKGKLDDATYLLTYDDYEMYGYIRLGTFSRNSTSMSYLTTTFPSTARSTAAKLACASLQVCFNYASSALSLSNLGISLANFGVNY